MSTNYPGSLDSYSTKVDGVDDVMAAHINNPQDAIEALEAHSQTMSLIKARNTSGATVAANDVGYIDEAGEFQTTTTAYLNAAWCVVISGAANNSDIIVCRRGRVTIELNGNCSAGDFLYTSTTTGQAQPQSYMRAEVFAVAITANSGGAGGTCEALLYTGTVYVADPDTTGFSSYFVGAHSDYDFISTIATLPGGAVLTYGAVTSGHENTIHPFFGTDNSYKLILHNTTRGNEARIDDVDMATNTITLTASVPGTWQVGDAITARSQTYTTVVGGARAYDFDVSELAPILARSLVLNAEKQDSGGTGEVYYTQPLQAASANDLFRNASAGPFTPYIFNVAIVNRTICLGSGGSGVGTAGSVVRQKGYFLAIP